MRGLFALIVGWIAIAAAAFGYVQAAGPQQQPSGAPDPAISPQRALLDRYCVTCHNQQLVHGASSSAEPSLLLSRLRSSGLTLDTVDVANVSEDAEVWEKVVQKLRAGAMPPPPRPRPDKATYDGFRKWLETELDRAAGANPNPGRTETFHRLNRAEYQNAIRDLLALEIDVASLLPADAADQHGFDNMAGTLSVSPALLERYVSAARKISRLAVGTPPHGPVVDMYPVPLNLVQDDRPSEDLPFGSRGGIAIRHSFPVDGEYLIKVRLQTNYVSYVRGMDAAHEIEIRLDGARIKQFTVGGEAPGMPAPLSFAGNIRGDPDWETYMLHADEGLEVRIPVKAGPRVVGVSFPRELWEPEGVLQPRQTGFALAVNETADGNPAVGSVEIAGPYTVDGPGDTPSRQKIFVCRPMRPADEAPCAKQILSTLARRAYRRPVPEGDVRTLLSFYEAGRRDGSFDAGIQFALERLLADPDFLFRIERDPVDIAPATAYAVSGLALASRLSFFLWSSIPDDELLDLAARGELSDPVVQEQQVRRMLADARSKALVDNFVGQWLYLRNLRSVYPDADVFPEFDENLREAFQRETELFIENLLREDRSVVELLNANYTFVNERLARHYGIPNIYGSRFRRVTFDNAERGGVLGHGSLMTVTSYPNRTSPVLRGKWVLENLLGTPPPEPPPNIPSLEERDTDGKALSIRDAMVQHRADPSCAVCHAPMDPLGFALENYDAIGEWRTISDARSPIDASGVLPDGSRFEGPAGLRALLLSRPDQFVGTVTAKLLTYALGRGVEYYDAPAVRKIVREAAGEDYRWSAIILGIVKSTPFQMRRSDS